MAETLTTQIALAINAVLAQAGLGTSQFNLNGQNLINAALSNGNAAGQANQIYAQKITLAGGASQSLNLYNFGGALDPVGNAYAQVGVKLVFIQNLSATESDTLLIGGDESGSAWTSPFNGSNSAVAVANGGGSVLFYDAGATGYPVAADGTNTVLKLANASGESFDINVIIIGITA